MNVVYISLYCYKSFPVRIFHTLSRKQGVNSHAVFLKNSSANNHRPITEKEIRIVLELIKEKKPNLIAMSILAPYVVVAKELTHEIRKISKVPIIVGGKYPTVFPDKALQFADYVCRGEGELVLLEIFERIKNGLDFKGIQGLWYKEENGKVVNQGQRMLIQNLDEIPFPSVADPQMYFIENDNLLEDDPEIWDSLIYIMSGRGCAFQCAYCVNSLLVPIHRGHGKFLRQRTPDNVISEIEFRMKKHKYPESVFFVDEVFGTSTNWTREFSEKYKEKVGLPFQCELFPNLIKEDNIKLLSKAGLHELNFGIQSGSDRIRNGVMNRPGTNREILQKVDVLRKYDVTPKYDLILNNPFETIETLQETIDLLLQLPRPLYFNVYKMQFFPEYPFSLKALKEGLISEEDLTDESLADSILKNWIFIPKVFSVDRRAYLESCIYLLAWNSIFGRTLSTYLSKRENRLLGLAANILAKINYYLIVKSPVWLRYSLFGLKLLASGDIRLLGSRIKRKLFQR